MITTGCDAALSRAVQRAAFEQGNAHRVEVSFGDPRDVGVRRRRRIGRWAVKALEAGALPVVGERHGVDQARRLDAAQLRDARQQTGPRHGRVTRRRDSARQAA